MIIEGIIFMVLLALWWKLRDDKKHEKCPPGPFRFPLLGNMPQLATRSTFPAEAIIDLSKTYGDVMTLQMGLLPSVAFTSHKGINAVFNQETSGSSRAPEMLPVIHDRMLQRNTGVIWSEGDVWQANRRFSLRTLRDFGFGKTMNMDFVVNEELEKFMNDFNKRLDAAPQGIVTIQDFFDLTVINILWRLVTGISYEMNDSKMIRLLNISSDMIKSSNMAVDIAVAFPFLHPFMGREKQLETRDILLDFIRDTLAEHRQVSTYSSDPQSFVDVFLGKIDEMKKDKETNFTDEQLVMTLLDLFQAGAETSSKTLTFGLLYMLLNPDIQKKVQDEIDNVVPKGEPITMSFRTQLPFCHATILEILRYSVVVPFPPLRKATEDFYYNGYLIRKGSALHLNIQACHFDKTIWGDPKTFRPERFLTSEGVVDSKMAEFVLSFGGGKRKCLGYQLADTNLFLYFTTMMRNYTFSKVPGKPDPCTTPILGITYTPQPYEAKVIRRK